MTMTKIDRVYGRHGGCGPGRYEDNYEYGGTGGYGREDMVIKDLMLQILMRATKCVS